MQAFSDMSCRRNRMRILRPNLLLAVGITAATLFAQSGWTSYSSQKYGFSMLVPQGTEMEDKEFGGGWAGAYGNHEGVEFFGIAKLGRESEKDIIQFGVEWSGVEEKHWTQIDQGKGYKVYKAEAGDHVLLAAVAIGSKASFLLFLKTTRSDMNRYKADYQKWYQSVEVH